MSVYDMNVGSSRPELVVDADLLVHLVAIWIDQGNCSILVISSPDAVGARVDGGHAADLDCCQNPRRWRSGGLKALARATTGSARHQQNECGEDRQTPHASF